MFKKKVISKSLASKFNSFTQKKNYTEKPTIPHTL
jgi:hypothetical protein